MKLADLIEEMRLNESSPVVIYFDPKNKTFSLTDTGKNIPIKDHKDYEKIAKQYNVDISVKDWEALTQEPNDIDPAFKRALDDMKKELKSKR